MNKLPVKKSSLIFVLLCWVLASNVMGYLFWSLRDRARLIRDNQHERLLTTIVSNFRSIEDINFLLESNTILMERIRGAALYDADFQPLYRWGSAPAIFDLELLRNGGESTFGRYTISEEWGGTIKFIIHTEPWTKLSGGQGGRNTVRAPVRPVAPVPGGEQARIEPEDFFDYLLNENYIYIEAYHLDYWRTIIATSILFPLVELSFLFIAFYIRNLYLRNYEYRGQLESQKNLVVVGTAASTLAHEIKNPLLSIRLQTGILSKLFPHTGKEELDAINEEVARLSALTYRVNDYLRDAVGERQALDSTAVLADVSQRLTGRNMVPANTGAAIVFMDEQRLRSVFENLIRNALESGGPAEEVAVSVEGNNGKITITIMDRGRGIKKADLKRVFDPFFTSKSTGTGIGLSVSKRFIEAAGGSIGLENREGGGALVRIILPEHHAEHKS
ncbi:MAG: HAMP domain-containing histidine kinase [Treponema sp.]|jgi:two-component system sensor histidine kinase HydH|nr:HAMP domain-containing histidine kinase [Treponema sp.]